MANENWEKKPRTKKGNYCEELVYSYLKRTYPTVCIYKSISDFAHPIDTICVDSDNPKKLFFLEVKGKEVRNFYPDTGFNLSQFNKYRVFAETYNKPVWIYFVDYKMKICYRISYQDMIQPVDIQYGDKVLTYPMIQKGVAEDGVTLVDVIYFPVARMRKVFDLTKEQCAIIESLTKEENKEKKCEKNKQKDFLDFEIF